MIKVWLGLGSNLGDREKNIKEAVRRLKESGKARDIKMSSLYETEPEGVKNQPPFLNGVLEMKTALPPRALLTTLQSLERQLGRGKGRRWGPRIIDLDILLYGDMVIKEEGLEIPHPFLAQRSFVLIPLAELAPGAIHPVLQKTISDLRDRKLLNHRGHREKLQD